MADHLNFETKLVVFGLIVFHIEVVNYIFFVTDSEIH
jgi:hypothetical protein